MPQVLVHFFAPASSARPSRRCSLGRSLLDPLLSPFLLLRPGALRLLDHALAFAAGQNKTDLSRYAFNSSGRRTILRFSTSIAPSR